MKLPDGEKQHIWGSPSLSMHINSELNATVRLPDNLADTEGLKLMFELPFGSALLDVVLDEDYEVIYGIIFMNICDYSRAKFKLSSSISLFESCFR